MMRFRRNHKASAKFFTLVSVFALVPLLSPAASYAQAYVSHVPPLTPAGGQQMNSPYGGYSGYSPVYGQAYGQNPYAGYQQTSQPSTEASSSMQQQSSGSSGSASTAGNTAPLNLGDLTDPTSPVYQANMLAIQAQMQRQQDTAFDQQNATDAAIDRQAPPPDMTSLQQVNKSQPSGASDIADDTVSKGLSLDMRKNAQREAALSYGARGGLAKRNFEIMQRMKGFDKVLDRVFDFRALLIKAPSGLLIEPPIIKESDKAVVVTGDGDEAAVADKVYDINKKAKIVTAPRDWRSYLIQSWSQVPPPPRILWPKSAKEQAEWDTWVAQGWDAGVKQADEIFEDQVNQLVADYNGMVRYKVLLAQDMITAPYAMHEDRGVAGNASHQMRVGDRAIRITGPVQFLEKADLWKPANQ